MPRKNVLARIKSAPSLLAISLLVLASLVCCIILFVFGSQPLHAPVRTIQDVPARHSLQLGAETYRLDVAATSEAKAKGLGGRQELEAQTGMLFPYDSSDQHCFWMKDMRFSIDIIWVGPDKRIVHMAEAVAPETYPESFCAEGQYIIEVPAGTARQYRLTVGQQLVF